MTKSQCPMTRTRSEQSYRRGEGALQCKSESAGKPLLLTRIFECVAPSAESQRDSATKPRVARNELPWENARDIGDNPEKVMADDHGNTTMPQPRWGCELSVTLTQGSPFLETLG